MRIRINKQYIERTLLFGLTALYVFLKVYRNSINYSNTSQGGIWNIILVFLVFCGSIYFFRRSNVGSNEVIRIGTVYALIIWINGLLTFTASGVNGIYYYIVAPSFIPILVFSYKTSGANTERENRLFDISWIAIFSLLFYTFIEYFGRYQYFESSGKIALNNSYYAVCAIPYFLKKRNRFGIGMVILAILIVFISNKRAGLIGVALSFLFYYLINAKLSGSFSKAVSRFAAGIVAFTIFYFAFQYIDNQYNLNIFTRLLALLSDGGSGRTEIYKKVWEEIFNSGFFSILFGHGVDSISNLGLTSAHNDFLNVFYEYGFFAALTLAFLYLSMFRCLKMMINDRYRNSDVFGCSIVLSLFLSLFSANLDDQSFALVLALYWGTEIAEWRNVQITNN